MEKKMETTIIQVYLGVLLGIIFSVPRQNFPTAAAPAVFYC